MTDEWMIFFNAGAAGILIGSGPFGGMFLKAVWFLLVVFNAAAASLMAGGVL